MKSTGVLRDSRQSREVATLKICLHHEILLFTRKALTMLIETTAFTTFRENRSLGDF